MLITKFFSFSSSFSFFYRQPWHIARCYKFICSRDYVWILFLDIVSTRVEKFVVVEKAHNTNPTGELKPIRIVHKHFKCKYRIYKWSCLMHSFYFADTIWNIGHSLFEPDIFLRMSVAKSHFSHWCYTEFVHVYSVPRLLHQILRAKIEECRIITVNGFMIPLFKCNFCFYFLLISYILYELS